MPDDKPGAKEVAGEIADVDTIKGTINKEGNPTHPSTNESQHELQGNKSGFNQITHTVSSADTAESLPDQKVPEGVSAAIFCWTSNNAGDIFLGDSDTQAYNLAKQGGIGLRIENLNNVFIKAPNAGDGVIVMWEG